MLEVVSGRRRSGSWGLKMRKDLRSDTDRLFHRWTNASKAKSLVKATASIPSADPQESPPNGPKERTIIRSWIGSRDLRFHLVNYREWELDRKPFGWLGLVVCKVISKQGKLVCKQYLG